MTRRILYICTHNRCRSILAEAITRHLSSGRLEAASAGSEPANEVHPLSIKYLKERGISTDGLANQSWHEFEDFKPDVILTMCDQAAEEECPVWFNSSLCEHWGLADPSKVIGDEYTIRQAFNQTIDEIEKRVSALLQQNLNAMGDEELRKQLRKLAA